jgi:8-oxo-dGTP pyrophosphatase MutT (NUDIX family)
MRGRNQWVPAEGGWAVKASFGVILCRSNPVSAQAEALLVRKRYTYAFAEFIHGRYTRGADTLPGAKPGADAPPGAAAVDAAGCLYASDASDWTPGGAAGWPPGSAAQLLDRMTTEELLDVWSLSFEQMWYRVWLSYERQELYAKKRARFHATFMQDGGAGLRRAVLRARGAGALLWEVPKGRRLNPREPDLLCAVRELYEETGVRKGEYRLIPGAKRRVAYVSGGVRYVCVYYLAMAGARRARKGQGPGPALEGARPREAAGPRPWRDPGRPALREIQHMGEVGEARWCSLEHVRLLAGPGSHLEALLAPAFRLMKRYQRGRWVSPRQSLAPTALEPRLDGTPKAPSTPEVPGTPEVSDPAGWRYARRKKKKARRPAL